MDKLEQITQRLEIATSKLESLASGSSKQQEGSVIADQFKTILDSSVQKFVDVSKKINEEVYKDSEIISQCFQESYKLMKVVATSKKPSQEAILQMLQPLTTKVTEVKNYASKNFKSTFKPHFEALAAYVDSFNWIVMPNKPFQYVSDINESALYYSNRVLSEFKKDVDHKEWVESVKKCFQDLMDYTKEYHSMGCAWNPSGTDASVSVQKSKSEPTPTPSKSSGGSGPSALFSEINKGGLGIAKGLKKVQDSEKTHKNPGLRVSSTVPCGPTSQKKSPSFSKQSDIQKPPKFELIAGKKWEINHQRNQDMLEIKEADPNCVVYMYDCMKTNVKIHPKLNVVSIDKCNDCQVQIVSGLISGVEITNSKKVSIHVDKMVPLVNINSSDGVQVYLRETSLSTKVTTSMSTAVNVCTFSETTELVEHPVPQILESVLVNGKLVTTIKEVV